MRVWELAPGRLMVSGAFSDLAGGDSAGGNLAAVTAQQAVDAAGLSRRFGC
jgi:alpha/beta hydrolase fold